jgi:3D-(3,5/4)-trihydroxycyclohexane-1,2-dione acylhydrolase (decyclizing)
MGHEIPAGLGIRMHEGAAPEVFVVIGDGTFLMNPTELVTAVQEHLKLTVVILDNGGYGSISGLARANTGNSVGNEFRSRADNARLPDGERLAVDHAGMARSMGCEVTRADSIDAFAAALSDARAAAATTVIVVPTAPDRALLASGAFWDLGVPEVAADPATAALATDHLTRRGAQRNY